MGYKNPGKKSGKKIKPPGDGRSKKLGCVVVAVIVTTEAERVNGALLLTQRIPIH